MVFGARYFLLLESSSKYSYSFILLSIFHKNFLEMYDVCIQLSDFTSHTASLEFTNIFYDECSMLGFTFTSISTKRWTENIFLNYIYYFFISHFGQNWGGRDSKVSSTICIYNLLIFVMFL